MCRTVPHKVELVAGKLVTVFNLRTKSQSKSNSTLSENLNPRELTMNLLTMNTINEVQRRMTRQ